MSPDDTLSDYPLSGDTSCVPGERRRQARDRGLGGIESVRVDPAGRALRLRMDGPVESPGVGHVRITGPGRPVRATHVARVRRREATLPDLVEITLDRLGDASGYTVHLVDPDDPARPMPGLDPRRAGAAFRFTDACADADPCPDGPPTDACGCDSGCDSGGDTGCGTGGTAPGPVIDIDYLAKDYDSFRRLLLDRLTLVSPDRTDREAADLGVLLVELLAYVGDQLSYQQDAVATEAYLGTARLRTSVRRHLRLVGHRMHDGCNARTWVHLAVDAPGVLTAGTFRFVTALPDLDGVAAVSERRLRAVPRGTYQVFEPLTGDDVPLRPEHNRIRLWTWGEQECELPRGATHATLLDGWTDEGTRVLRLEVGDVLVLEEVLGPRTGVPGDADPRHRQAVRLTAVRELTDPVHRVPLLEVRWAAADALTFDARLSTVAGPGCCLVQDVTVARGNIVLADHGATDPAAEVHTVAPAPVRPGCCDGPGRPVPSVGVPRFAPRLGLAPVTRSAPYPDPAQVAAAQADRLDAVLDGPGSGPDDRPRLARLAARARAGWPLPAAGTGADTGADTGPDTGAGAARLLDPRSPAAAGPAATALVQDPRAALARLWVTADGQDWTVRADLLRSGPADRDVVAEVDDAGATRLRFGDGELGRAPEAGQEFAVRARVGNGTAGNVAAGAVAHVVLARPAPVPIGAVRNPLPARGGVDPEPVARARSLGPTSARSAPPARAVVAADYAAVAEHVPGVQDAVCDLAWNGAWYSADVALDPLGRTGVPRALTRRVDLALRETRRIGHDVRVRPAGHVRVDVTLAVCVVEGASWGLVSAELRRRLGAATAPDGRTGPLHPDRLRFGSAIAASALVAAAMGVPGVRSVTVRQLGPVGDPPAVFRTTPWQLPVAGDLRLEPVTGRTGRGYR